MTIGNVFSFNDSISRKMWNDLRKRIRQLLPDCPDHLTDPPLADEQNITNPETK
jgi:hypothetical protein